jgi:hypothetical protein
MSILCFFSAVILSKAKDLSKADGTRCFRLQASNPLERSLAVCAARDDVSGQFGRAMNTRVTLCILVDARHELDAQMIAARADVIWARSRIPA